jgi:hypothetical protein
LPDYDVIVIGAGAAGLMCAMTAGQRGQRVLLLDHADKAGKKIRISGGGRCNFTNLKSGPEYYLSRNPRFTISALSRYTPQDFLALIVRHRIAWEERDEEQLFCRQSAQAIIDMLLTECEASGVELRLDCRVQSVARDGCFNLDTNTGPLSCASLVVATGGLSFAKIGASDFGYRVARQFGLEMVPLAPALAPFIISGSARPLLDGLAGISVDADVRCGKQGFRGNILVTHKGLSGPAILQISSYWLPGEAIHIDLLPDTDIVAYLARMRAERPKAELKTVLAQLLPKRLVQHWCESLIPNAPLNQLSPKQIEATRRALHAWQVVPSGTEGYRTAEVTVGGVDTRELSSKTMEARKVPGLYFIGEVVDVTGHLGGFNFQWAWASGYCAGQYV